jgi:Flp pilus assembly protein TadD/predicted Zn-dependent protease with MMP-like domain
MRAWFPLLSAVWLGCACQKTEPAHPAAPNPGTPTAPVHHPSRPAAVEPLAVCDSPGVSPLDAARAAYQAENWKRALSCAAEAAARSPDDPAAHSERAAALSALGRFDEARMAYARALALDPDHLDALLGAAHLYGVSLPSSRETDELAFLYAERGRQLAGDGDDQELTAQFALLSAMAANDLGEPTLALERADEAGQVLDDDADVAFERAVALFELCRFEEARTAFTALLDDADHGAHAYQHLGLLLEREGKWAEAEASFRKARQLAPEDFPPPVLPSEAEFRAAVSRAVKALPKDMQKVLSGVPVAAEEIPQDEDLRDGDPPLSPTILGLFRGPSLGEPCPVGEKGPCRSVVLYRRNLARAVTTKEELLEQIRVTLLHEVGHLRGEDDLELAARGLE